MTVLEKPRVSTTPSPWQDPARLGAIYPSTEFVGRPKTPSQDDHPGAWHADVRARLLRPTSQFCPTNSYFKAEGGRTLHRQDLY